MKSPEDAVAELAQDVALAQYKMRMWQKKNEANNRQAKVFMFQDLFFFFFL